MGAAPWPKGSPWVHRGRPVSLLCVLLLLATLSCAAAQAAPGGCTPLATVIVDSKATTAGCCGSQALPCGGLAAALLNADPSGAQILLRPGTYKAPATGLDLSAARLEISADGTPAGSAAAPAVIECGQGPCLLASCAPRGAVPCAQATLTLRGLTVQNGAADGDGGCLSVVNQAVTLTDVKFRSCTAGGNGGAVSVLRSPKAVLTGVSARASASNAAADSSSKAAGGGSVAIISSKAVTVTRLDVANSYAALAHGGALLISDSEANVTGATLRTSQAGILGGCAATFGSTVTIRDAAMTRCESYVGGCLGDRGSTIALTNATCDRGVANTTGISSTEDLQVGGCLAFLVGTSAAVTLAKLTNCKAVSYGGGVSAQNHVSFSLSNSTVEGCYSELSGGGIDIEYGPGEVSDSQIVNNIVSSAGPYGGGMFLSVSNTAISRCNVSGNDITSTVNPGAKLELSQGGGIYATGDKGILVTADNCLFQGNKGLRGAGVYAESSCPLTVTDSNFTANTARAANSKGGYGGAAEVWSAAVSFSGCRFVGNLAATSGGAVSVQCPKKATVTFSKSTFANNTALAGDGGAISIPPLVNATTSVSDCVFESNKAARGNAGAMAIAAPASIVGSLFSANSAAFKGGAVAVTGTAKTAGDAGPSLPAVTTVTSTQFQDNKAPLGGGALFVSMGGKVLLSECRLTGNEANTGGAILVEDSSIVSLNSSTCKGNTAVLSGGCASAGDTSNLTAVSTYFLRNAGGDQGGAIRITGFASLTVGKGSAFAGNTALGGGGIWGELFSKAAVTGTKFIQNSAAFYGGGVYLLHSAAASLSACKFDTNKAPLGGAALLEDGTLLSSQGTDFKNNAQHALAVRGKATLGLEGGVLSGNQAGNVSGSGGAVWVSESGSANLTGATLSRNSAEVGGGLSAALGSFVYATGCNFTGNAAQKLGGGAHAEDGSSLTLTNCHFTGNDAGESGAGVAYMGNTQGSVEGTEFLNNSAAESGAGIYLQRGPVGVQAAAQLAAASNTSSSPLSASKVSDASGTPPVTTIGFAGLQFSGSSAQAGQGSAFFDGSFLPELRSNCTGCNAALPSVDTIGSLPSSLLLQWRGLNSSAVAGPIPIMADVGTPVEGLAATLFDSNGQVASAGYAAVVEVQSDPRISGLLRGTPVNGSTLIPTFAVTPQQDTSANFTLAVTVSSPSGAFPPFTTPLQISFCAPGYFLNSTDFLCYICPIGSWCATGQGSQFCPANSYAFYPGQSSVNACVACPDTATAGGDGVLSCGEGTSTLAAGWWLDMGSLNSTPAVYPCDISRGCTGMTYQGPATPQCGPEYQETRLCSVCTQGYFNLLGTCYACGTPKANLFPLWATLVALLWAVTAVVSASYHSVSIFVMDVQIIAVLGSLNLEYPAWIQSLIELASISLLDPSITAVGCFYNFSFRTTWLFGFAVAATGIAAFLLLYLVLRATSSRKRAKGGGGRELALDEVAKAMEETESPPENKAVRWLINWLDLVYLPLAIRCMQAFYWLQFDITALGFAPLIPWWTSSTSQLLFWIAISVVVLYLFLWPLAFLGILVYAKTHQLLQARRLRKCLGGMLTRYEPNYFWWHSVMFVRRIYYACIFVFLHNQPGLQMVLLIPAQVVRLGLQFAAAPLTAGSHDLLSSSLIIAEILFAISITGNNFLLGGDSVLGTLGLAAFLALFCGSVAVTFPYEAINKYVEFCKRRACKKLWKRAQAGDRGPGGEGGGFTDSENGFSEGPCPSIDPRIVASWFRPHVISQVLLPAHRFNERAMLLQVCCLYEKALKASPSTLAKAGGMPGVPGGGTEDSDVPEGIGESALGNVLWTKGLKKSQLFAALHQVVLGAEVGEKVVAEVPLKPEDVSMWADDLHQTGGANIDLSASRTLARFRQTSILGRRGVSFRQVMSGRRGSIRGSARRAAFPPADSQGSQGAEGVGGGGGSLPRYPRAGSGNSSASHHSEDGSGLDPLGPHMGTPGALPPLTEEGSPRVSEGGPGSTEHGAAGGGVVEGIAGGGFDNKPAGLVRRKKGMERSLDDDDDEVGSGRGALGEDDDDPMGKNKPPRMGMARSLEDDDEFGGSGTPPVQAPPQRLQSIASVRFIDAQVRLVDEKPAELWPPPLEHRATWVVKNKDGTSNLGGAGAPGAHPDQPVESGAYLEALLDSMGMSLVFQESFGQLTLVEKKSKPHSLRRLCTSTHIKTILAWFSSPACTMDDRKLFVDFLNAVRDAATAEAGALSWKACTLNVMRLSGISGGSSW